MSDAKTPEHGPTLSLSVKLSPEDIAALVRFTDEVRAKARAEDCAQERGVKWRPIETAGGPDSCLLTDGAYTWIGFLSFGSDGMEWRTNDESATDLPPTHWQPLPESPAAIRARGSHA